MTRSWAKEDGSGRCVFHHAIAVRSELAEFIDSFTSQCASKFGLVSYPHRSG